MAEKSMMEVTRVLEKVEVLCAAAGAAIMEVYEKPTEHLCVTEKEDHSPLTEADLAANSLIVNTLPEILPGVPIISEECPIPEFHIRQSWRRYWLIDPLDGTKEFIKRNGEFTVNIALIENGEAVLGCVYAPVSKTTYSGIKNVGAWKQINKQRCAIQPRSLAPVVENKETFYVIGSRMYGIPPLPKGLSEIFHKVESRVIGSSLKFCLLAEGRADFYPRLAPTKEWDTAAAQAVLQAAGGLTMDEHLSLLRYNQKDSLLNPNFYAVGDKQFDWRCLTA